MPPQRTIDAPLGSELDVDAAERAHEVLGQREVEISGA
jgi:hypothetical protein